ncbi:MAG: DUF3820 family protein [Pseudomonadota bacterium]
MILAFGKYRGYRLSEIPLSYLAWIFETLDGKPELHEATRQEIRRRVSGYEPNPEPLDADRLRRVYRTLAVEHHPDHGGDNHVMAGINLFYEAIRQ